MEAEVKPKSLISKLAEVLAAVGWVKKNGRNQFFNYQYATESDVMDAVREELGKRGVFVLTSIESVECKETGRKTKGGDAIVLTTVKTKHTFHDGESGQTIEGIGYGCGEDSADKGVYKAVTGAMKYFISKNFLLSTGDDPEKDQEEKPHNGNGVHTLDAESQAKQMEIEKSWRKYRAKVNKLLQSAKTLANLEAVRAMVEKETAPGLKGGTIWTHPTYRDATDAQGNPETFGMLYDEHKARIAKDAELAKPEAIDAWLAKLAKVSTVANLADYVKMYRTQARLQDDFRITDALTFKAQDLGLHSFADVEENNEIHAEAGTP